MTPHQLVSLLQLSDSMFPVGAFAYSDGLETAANQGLVANGGGLREWLHHYVYGVFLPSDGRAMLKTLSSYRSSDYGAIADLDVELWALRPSGAVRASSAAIGKRLLAAFVAMHNDRALPVLPYGNCAVAYGVVYADYGFSNRDALVAFGYARLAGIVSAGLRLVSMGHEEGQRLLAEAGRHLAAAVEIILDSQDEPLRSFSPRMDIAQMNHQYVYSRLFRS